jgi:hypothetical protein
MLLFKHKQKTFICSSNPNALTLQVAKLTKVRAFALFARLFNNNSLPYSARDYKRILYWQGFLLLTHTEINSIIIYGGGDMANKKFVVPEYKEIDHSLPKERGALWCPYDGSWQLFEPKKKDGYLTYPRCGSCGISTEDWYVKTINGLWEDASAKAKAKKKK